MTRRDLASCLLLLLSPIAAQTSTTYSPSGAEHCTGGSGNTIPFWGQSAAYQQIHDYQDMNWSSGGKSLTIQALALRKFPGPTVWEPRSMEVQLAMATTTISLDQAVLTWTFAAHYSSSPTIVLPNTRIDMPRVKDVGSPNPPGLVLPFSSKFLWVNKSGNHLIWEWRHLNNTNSTPMFADSVYYDPNQNSGSSWGCNSPPEGVACTATGRTVPANATTTLTGNPPWRTFTLADVEPNRPAMLFVGAQRQRTTLPGLCSSLELSPLFGIPGTTSNVGCWSTLVQLPAQSQFRGKPFAQLLFQYAFGDSGLPYGVGLTQAMVVNPPMPGMFDICRFWAMDWLNTTNSWAAATQATGATRYGGLVVALL